MHIYHTQRGEMSYYQKRLQAIDLYYFFWLWRGCSIISYLRWMIRRWVSCIRLVREIEHVTAQSCDTRLGRWEWHHVWPSRFTSNFCLVMEIHIIDMFIHVVFLIYIYNRISCLAQERRLFFPIIFQLLDGLHIAQMYWLLFFPHQASTIQIQTVYNSVFSEI